MLYLLRPLVALGFAAFGSLALAQSRPAKTAAPPPAPVAEAPAGQGRCNEDDAGLSRLGRDMSALEVQSGDPRAALQTLIDTTLSRSKALGAVRLLTDAARSDLEETRAMSLPTATLSIGTTGINQTVGGATVGRGGQLSTTLSAGMPLWDFGRIAKLTEWRKELAEVAQQGQRSAEEQLSLNVVTLALDRSRYVLQGQVYTQYVRKMACLVDALEIITKADRGRASELVQAQKSLQQADLSLEQTMSALRQTEVRMRRLVGEPLPPSIGMTAQLSVMPDLEQMQSDILLGADVAQAEAQARSQRSFAESVIAGQKPTVSLTGSASAILRSGGPNDARQTDIGAGVSVTIPILQPGAHAQASAAVQRYRATVLQRDEAIEAKRYRLLEMNEVGVSTLDRARRIVEILRNSDRVRASTLQQWQQLGRRSLFDVMAAEGDYYSMRVAHVNAMFDAQQIVALIWSMGRGVAAPLR
ncbi:TolC family protein [Roseateles sp. NT4]|uniref:TolC family protein n=1 Tax=Roseateles sp. NT4 TaxID=3453715 RepID=UPI003EEFBE10